MDDVSLRIKNLSNEELLRMLKGKESDYLPKAWQVALQQIEARGGIESIENQLQKEKVDSVIKNTKILSHNSMIRNSQNQMKSIGLLIGMIIGGGIGFLIRPANMLTGQIDFATMITCGQNLTGLNTLLKEQATTSFAMFVGGVVIGGIIGYLIGIILDKLTPSESNKHIQPFDVADQIKKLAALKNEGILTEIEFNDKKSKLLSRDM
jgi:Short C-terminal domain